MNWLLLLACLTPQETAPVAPHQDVAGLRARVVLELGDAQYTVGNVLNASLAYNPELASQFEQADLLRLHLRSLRFLHDVHSFADLKLIEQAGVPSVEHDALLSEAGAWAAERGLRHFPESALASYGLEIEARARLIGEQTEQFSTPELRQHFMTSIAEYFGEMTASWIRVRLTDERTGAALPPAERLRRYEDMVKLADELARGEIEWDAAVQEHCEDELTRPKNGYLGILERTMVPRYEEPLLRELFSGLGIKKIEKRILRGPITGDRWLYLVRIEWVGVNKVVDMQRVLPRVERSLRNHLLGERLHALRAGAPRTVTLPQV